MAASAGEKLGVSAVGVSAVMGRGLLSRRSVVHCLTETGAAINHALPDPPIAIPVATPVATPVAAPVAAPAAVIGAGPAGLMAAEVLADAGHAVAVFDQMPSPGRKLLMAGRGGLNLTHTEDLACFLDRYGPARPVIEPCVRGFPPAALQDWCAGLGEPCFTGSSGRVFPRSFKAAPLLRAWLRRLGGRGVQLHVRHRWAGWQDGALRFETPAGPMLLRPAVTVLALGGASWPRLGSDGGWADILRQAAIPIAPFRPANAGLCIPWSPHFRERFDGAPLKRIALSCDSHATRGEAVVTQGGLEGGGAYALSAALRDRIARDGAATLRIDLRPDLDHATLRDRLAAPRGGLSMANWLRRAAGLSPVGIGLVREAGAVPGSPAALADRIKAIVLPATGTQGLERAISSAGGVALSALTDTLMLRGHPGLFVAGEMLDWEAPTGGYLLQATISTAAMAARGAVRWLKQVR